MRNFTASVALASAFVGAVIAALSIKPDWSPSYSGAATSSYAKNSPPVSQTKRASVSTSLINQRGTSRFLNPATKKYVVLGTGLPDVDFDIGESYAGLIPISSAVNETRELFFWFFPTANPAGSSEVTIWLNGGPGCSSLGGLLQENGPFLWQPGTFAPVPNPYSWTNLTNMLYVEQPVSVGLTQGTPDIYDEVGLGHEFLGFFKNFVDDFELQGSDIYLTGESYGGFYIPHIGNAMILANDTCHYNFKGAYIIDPLIGDPTLHFEVAIVPLLDYWSSAFSLNESTMADVHNKADSCNFTSIMETYLTFPPPGPLPTLVSPGPDCDVNTEILTAALLVNPCFNVYHVTDTCPHLWSVLGAVNVGDYEPASATVYFNRPDVQAAINARRADWSLCKQVVFAPPPNDTNPNDAYDHSDPPALDGILQKVIEYTNNVIIAVGKQDYLLPSNGTLLVLQNVTWNGRQGFQSPPTSKVFVPYHPEYFQGALAGAGDAGEFVTDRGLTFTAINLSGHEMPLYAPGVAYRILEKLLGRIPSLDTPGDFTTQTSNFSSEAVLDTFVEQKIAAFKALRQQMGGSMRRF